MVIVTIGFFAIIVSFLFLKKWIKIISIF
jgi:hypothetical protein